MLWTSTEAITIFLLNSPSTQQMPFLLNFQNHLALNLLIILAEGNNTCLTWDVCPILETSAIWTEKPSNLKEFHVGLAKTYISPGSHKSWDANIMHCSTQRVVPPKATLNICLHILTLAQYECAGDRRAIMWPTVRSQKSHDTPINAPTDSIRTLSLHA